jgi:peptidoglycan-associated lipoprotein
MGGSSGRGTALRAFAVASALAFVAGCGHVEEEVFNAEIDLLRQEMRDGDQQVADNAAAQVDAVDTRVTELESEQTALAARLDGLESDLGALQAEFEVTVERMEAAIRFNTPIHFAFDDATIPAESEALLDQFVATVSNYYEGATITVEGFTDPSGSPEYNMMLGQRRADAVRDYLSAAGIPADQLRSVSYGEQSERQINPQDTGPGTAGWQNRRVSMVIDFSGGTPPAEPVASDTPSVEPVAQVSDATDLSM